MADLAAPSHRQNWRFLKSGQRFFRLILLCHIGAPWIAFNKLSLHWFTRMMEFGLFPAVLVFLGFGLILLWTCRNEVNIRTPAFVGFVASALMALIGFSLGGMITVSNTLIAIRN